MEKIVHNVETGEIEKVAFSETELEQQQERDEIWLQQQAAKLAAKAQAEAKLAALGLTPDDLKALNL